MMFRIATAALLSTACMAGATNTVVTIPVVPTNAATVVSADPSASTPATSTSTTSTTSSSTQNSIRAGSMAVDRDTNEIYLTGTSVKDDLPSCWIASMDLRRLRWQQQAGFGSTTDTCRSLAVLEEDIMVGSTASFLSDPHHDGFGTTVHRGELGLVDGDSLHHPDGVQSDAPLAVVADAAAEYVYVVIQEVANGGTADSIKIEKYSLTSRKNKRSSSTHSATPEWSNKLTSFVQPDNLKVEIAGLSLSHSEDRLLMAGTLQGDKKLSFVAALDPTDGVSLLGFDKDLEQYKGSAADEVVGLCEDTYDSNLVYLVGQTSFQGKKIGFIKQIQLDDMTVQWQHQFVSSTEAKAHGCAVYKSHVAVTGVVKDGGAIQLGRDELTKQKSFGMDDIFVGRFERSGLRIWLKQFGTDGQEDLAEATAIGVDITANPVVFGDTTGALWHEEGGEADTNDKATRDLMVLVFDALTGDVVKTAEKSFSPGHDVPSAIYTPTGLTLSRSWITYPLKSAWLGLVPFCALVLCCLYGRRHGSRNKRADIYEYLQEFDVEDIDPRKSPLGGWNVIYKNGLENGINLKEADSDSDDEDDLELSPTSQSTKASLMSWGQSSPSKKKTGGYTDAAPMSPSLGGAPRDQNVMQDYLFQSPVAEETESVARKKKTKRFSDLIQNLPNNDSPTNTTNRAVLDAEDVDNVADKSRQKLKDNTDSLLL